VAALEDPRDVTVDAGSRDAETSDAVAAHVLLGSSAVIATGILTLLDHWSDMPEGLRTHLLQRMLVHAGSIDRHLKELALGRLGAAG